MNDTLTELILELKEQRAAHGLNWVEIFDGSAGPAISDLDANLSDGQRSLTLRRKFEHFTITHIAAQLLREASDERESLISNGTVIDKYAIVIHQAPLRQDHRSIEYTKIVSVKL